jgi:hypothetical protein
MICLFPLVGFMAENFGFSITFAGTAIIYIPVMVFLIKKLTRQNMEELRNESILV